MIRPQHKGLYNELEEKADSYYNEIDDIEHTLNEPGFDEEDNSAIVKSYDGLHTDLHTINTTLINMETK